MRRVRIALTSLLVLGAVFTASAVAAVAGQDDGTLAVQDGNGLVAVNGTGTVIGRVDGAATVRIVDPSPNDGSPLQLPKCPNRQNVSAKTLDPNDKIIVCSGEDIRFRLVGGAFRVTISGKGINLSVAGQGRVTLEGIPQSATGDDTSTGWYSVNDSDTVLIPMIRTVFHLDASATT
jgi:hypothetical protein